MSDRMEHTPRPFAVTGEYRDVISDAKGNPVCMVAFHNEELPESVEIRDFVLTACNNYERAIEACRGIVENLQPLCAKPAVNPWYVQNAVAILNAVIAEAKGTTND